MTQHHHLPDGPSTPQRYPPPHLSRMGMPRVGKSLPSYKPDLCILTVAAEIHGCNNHVRQTRARYEISGYLAAIVCLPSSSLQRETI